MRGSSSIPVVAPARAIRPPTLGRRCAGADLAGVACGAGGIARGWPTASMTTCRRCWPVKLPLLQSKPELIFGGESRTVYPGRCCPGRAVIGRPAGAAVNLAYDAGGAAGAVAAMRRAPERFKDAQVVVSIAPFLFNEGGRGRGGDPQDCGGAAGRVRADDVVFCRCRWHADPLHPRSVQCAACRRSAVAGGPQPPASA